MILLDTHVMSEPLRQAPEARVIEWSDAQAMETLFLAAITVAQLRTGVALLPAGKWRAGLQENLEKRVLPLFAGRAQANGFAVTTRDTSPFDVASVTVIKPWAHA